jgi:glycolate oxidase FAD binding subunit
MARFSPATLAELHEAVAAALAAEEALELVAGGSKRDLGRPMQTPHLLDLSPLSGIRSYEPHELVLTAAAATPLDEIEAVLAQHAQMLAFEPPDWRLLLGTPETRPTLGGVLACNLSGPRRIKAGAARDHFLGFRAVSGRGEIFKSGGRVVKNVTGYDLTKLMAGSYGTLAALEEVTVKVLPRPEQIATVALCGLAPAAAARAMGRALASPYEVCAAAYLPAGTASATSDFPSPAPMGGLERPARFPTITGAVDIVALRLEGPPPSVAYRRDRLLTDLAADCEATVLDDTASANFWRALGNVEPFAPLGDRAIWRISVAPARGAEAGEAVARKLEAVWYLDWGGGLVWAAIAGAEDGGAAVVRAAIRGADGRGTGHATLIKGAPGIRSAVPVFEPQPEALAALSARIKDAFDPRHILNPGRMVDRS